jgi:hypothetical protein
MVIKIKNYDFISFFGSIFIFIIAIVMIFIGIIFEIKTIFYVCGIMIGLSFFLIIVCIYEKDDYNE